MCLDRGFFLASWLDDMVRPSNRLGISRHVRMVQKRKKKARDMTPTS